MKPVYARFVVIAIFLLGAVFSAHTYRAPVKEPLNVIYIFTDDQKFNTIHALNNPEIITPNLDRLVSRGFVFNNAYCFGGNAPAVCVPSRNMNMTGNTFFHFKRDKGNWRNQPRDNGTSATFPKTMKAAGYETFYREKSGSANLPTIQKQFDYYEDVHMVKALSTGYAARSTVNDAIDYLHNTRNKAKPFFRVILKLMKRPQMNAAIFRW